MPNEYCGLKNLDVHIRNKTGLPVHIAEDPLFSDGLGLDSIDALEIAMAISQKFNVQLQAEDERNEEIFLS